ncbi:hypothetical protein EDD11_010461 [Mortierella claussenii]|nr:hypothetical protein EDD11_010461 [Mortierella claussenii]
MSTIQSSIASEADSNVKKVVITNVDSWLGCCAAYHLAQELEKKCKGVEIICFAHKTEHLDKLKKFKNVRIHKADYESRESLEKGLHGVCLTVLIPEQDDRRVKMAKNVLEAMKSQRVKSLILISVEGAGESSSNLKEIASYHEIEKHIENHCDCYVILRKSFLNQCFMLWAPIVQEKGEFPISTDKDSEMAPLDMCDLLCAIDKLVVDCCHHKESRNLEAGSSQLQSQESQQPSHPETHGSQQQQTRNEDEYDTFDKHKNKVYTLTGPQKITPERIVQELNDITGEKIKLKQVSREELQKYLQTLKKREDDGNTTDIDVDWCYSLLQASYETKRRYDHNDGDRGHLGDGDHHRNHHHFAPNDATINLILDELELVKQGDAGFVSGDLEKLTGHSGKTIKDFLRKEKDAFRSGHRHLD